MNPTTLNKIRRGLLVVAAVLAVLLFALDRYAIATHVPNDSSTRVVIYTTAWCSYCKALRENLDAAGILYVEYDVERSVEGQLGFWALRGRGVPVSVVGSKVIYGYQLPEIESALAPLGHTLSPASRH